jgi:hypothetical protein
VLNFDATSEIPLASSRIVFGSSHVGQDLGWRAAPARGLRGIYADEIAAVLCNGGIALLREKVAVCGDGERRALRTALNAGRAQDVSTVRG